MCPMYNRIGGYFTSVSGPFGCLIWLDSVGAPRDSLAIKMFKLC